MPKLTIQVVKKEKGWEREHLQVRKRKTVLRGESGTFQEVNRCCWRQGVVTVPCRVLPSSPIQHLHGFLVQYTGAVLAPVHCSENQWLHVTVALPYIATVLYCCIAVHCGKGLQHLEPLTQWLLFPIWTLWRFQIVTGELHHFSDRSQHHHFSHPLIVIILSVLPTICFFAHCHLSHPVPLVPLVNSLFRQLAPPCHCRPCLAPIVSFLNASRYYYSAWWDLHCECAMWPSSALCAEVYCSLCTVQSMCNGQSMCSVLFCTICTVLISLFSLCRLLPLPVMKPLLTLSAVFPGLTPHHHPCQQRHLNRGPEKKNNTSKRDVAPWSYKWILDWIG